MGGGTRTFEVRPLKNTYFFTSSIRQLIIRVQPGVKIKRLFLLFLYPNLRRQTKFPDQKNKQLYKTGHSGARASGGIGVLRETWSINYFVSI